MQEQKMVNINIKTKLALQRLKKIKKELEECHIVAEEKSLLVLRTNLKQLIDQKSKALSEYLLLKGPNIQARTRPINLRLSICPINGVEELSKHFIPNQRDNISTNREEKKELRAEDLASDEDSDDMENVDELEGKEGVHVKETRLFHKLKNK
jgi:hypothetical protein